MIAIRDNQEFESALEEAIGLFDHPHVVEGAANKRLGDLLDAIGHYRPKIEAAAHDPLPGQLAALTKRLDALHAQRRKDHPAVSEDGIDTGGFIFPG